MTSRRREKVRAFAVAGVMTLVLGACASDDAVASQGATKLANRTLTPAATGGAGTGPTETGPTETGSLRAPAQAAPDVVETGECNPGARSRLELTDTDRRIKVRFEVRRSPVGHSWHIVLRHFYTGEIGSHNDPPLHARILASESGVFVVLVRVRDQFGPFEDDFLRAKAADAQTGQVCTVEAAWWGPGIARPLQTHAPAVGSSPSSPARRRVDRGMPDHRPTWMRLSQGEYPRVEPIGWPVIWRKPS